MKKLYFSLFAGLLSSFSFAQNSFPPNGNIGIGTVNPVSPLTVVGRSVFGNGNMSVNDLNDIVYLEKPGYVQMRLYQPQSGVHGLISINNNGEPSMANGSYTTGMQIWTGSNHRLSFGTNSTERMTILGSGYVGIGAANPQNLLSIKGWSPWGLVKLTPSSDNGEACISFNTRSSDVDNSNQWLVGAGPWGLGSSFVIGNSAYSAPVMTFNTNGNIGIGTNKPDTKLAVNGTIHTQEVRVDMTGWSDYVFKPAYQLPSLAFVKSYIEKNNHLPEVPSEEDVVKNGINLGEIVRMQTKKIEELTLYLIQQQERIDKLEKNLSKKRKVKK
ncbi:hypothetical protein [Mucilaginibacter lacusdianchii]|uniref:hypothetical protein n=1 Tax=Mucilaginibacter lacusdianchii TaxID=2684211 RepID=UPI00131E64A0|nr:hypothetical protein [Mucilaginibacter sp. JXJ CY 39]